MLCETDRVVPVVIFLDRGSAPTTLSLGGDRHTYLHFRYLACRLAEIPYDLHRESDNLVARVNLPNMAWDGVEEKLDAYAQALRGLLALEPSFERRAKYVEFVDIYGGLDDNERRLFEERYPQEGEQMVGVVERAREEGRREGEALLLRRQLRQRFGELPEWVWPRLQRADSAQLEQWSERILSADNLEALFDGE